MEQLGAKIFLTNDIEEYTDSELKSLETLIAIEINNRQNRKQQKAWAELCDAFKKYDSKYGVVFENSDNGDEYVMISVDEDDCGRFYYC